MVLRTPYQDVAGDFLFIGGCGRSGTTLVVDVLGLHPRISPIYETDFVMPIAVMLAKRTPLPQVIARVRSLMDQWTAPLPHRPHNKRAHERVRFYHFIHICFTFYLIDTFFQSFHLSFFIFSRLVSRFTIFITHTSRQFFLFSANPTTYNKPIG